MRKYSFCLVFTIICIIYFGQLKAQSFTEYNTIELKSIRGETYYGITNKIKSYSDLIVFGTPIYEKEDTTLFFSLDKKGNITTISWKTPKNIFGRYDICTAGVQYPKGRVILLGDDYLYSLVEKSNQKYKTKKKIHIPAKDEKYYNGIHFYNYPNDKYVLLTNTYDYSQSDRLHDNFRIAIFNMKRGEIEKSISLNLGKGIAMSNFNYQWICSSENNIAVANPSRPEVYLLNKQLQIYDTININYLDILKTDSIINVLFSDEYLIEHKTSIYDKIKDMIDNDILKLPKIEKIAFINNDVLFILVQSTVNSNDTLWYKKKIHYFYSIDNKTFLQNNGTYSDYNYINSSEPLWFVDNITISILDSANNDETFSYYARYSKLEIDQNPNKIESIAHDELPDTSKLLLYNMDSATINYIDYKYVIISDIFSCSNCIFDNRYNKILVIHHNTLGTPLEITHNLIAKGKYNKMFTSPTVVFCNKKDIKETIATNKIYKISP